MQPQKNDVNGGRLSVLLGVLAFLIFSFEQASFGEQFPLSRPDPINWIIGPATANLGDYATIKVPDGYRFATADDAKILLRQNNNPAPKTLAGIIAPIYGKWLIVFEFNDVGYVPDNGREQMDSQAVLAKLREKLQHQNEQNGGSVSAADVSWETEPKYNGQEHTLEWAIRAESAAGKAINHVLRILGRDGFVDGIAVQPPNISAEVIPLKDLMSGIAFKEGHTYADYKKGDRISRLGLTELIAPEDTTEKKTSLAWILAVAGSVVALTGIGLVVVVVRKRNRSQKTLSRSSSMQATSQTNGSLRPPTFRGELPPLREAHVNGKINGDEKTRRRKIFDYQKYYSDLLFQVSDRTYEMDAPKPARNGSSARTNGVYENANQSAVAANLGLIESQKHLIEEQQRLIREQTKLIEEKTKLIQEKNQVLEKQAELFGNNVF